MTATIPAGTWSTPHARPILRHDAPRAEWLAARTSGIGGSDASTVAGVNPYESLYSLWLDKTGRASEKPQTDAMEWGHRLEPVIQQWFTDTTGIAVRRAGLMQARQHPWQLVNVDGLTGDGGIAEWKTTVWRTTDAEVWQDGEVPDHAEIQVQHGLAVTGRTHAHCVVLIDGRTPLHRVVERDQGLIDTITGLERDFWSDYVAADIEPPVDGSDATADALKARYGTARAELVSVGADTADLVEQLKAAKERVKATKAEQQDVENRMRATFGTATDLAYLGDVVATLHQNGSFSETRLAAEDPELHAAYQTDMTPRFDLARFKAEQPDVYARHRARVLRTPKPKPVKEN